MTPIFSRLEDKYGIPLGEAVYRIEASCATRVVAEAPGIKRGAPLLAIERTTYSTDGTPVDFEQMFYRGDRIRYTMRLKRRRPSAATEPETRPTSSSSSRAPAVLGVVAAT